MKSLSIKEVEYTAFTLARKTMTFNEPIPDFSTRSPNILESCLLIPFQSFGGKSLYKGLIGKAAILFYLMIKNHPFQNGNKRIAITALLVFLHKNKVWIEVDTKELYNFAIWVAESNPKLKKNTVEAIETFIGTYLIKLKG
ncbi:MAG: type II toxin-antitoxin system death-on-curing family toxin [Candidatus Paceibacterota bacterium]|jgi:prophage maintenance system killer protein